MLHYLAKVITIRFYKVCEDRVWLSQYVVAHPYRNPPHLQLIQNYTSAILPSSFELLGGKKNSANYNSHFSAYSFGMRTATARKFLEFVLILKTFLLKL